MTRIHWRGRSYEQGMDEGTVQFFEDMYAGDADVIVCGRQAADGDTEEAIRDRVRKVLAGGYDLEALRRTEPFIVKPRRGKSEERALQEAETRLGRTREEQRMILAREMRLDGLREEQAAGVPSLDAIEFWELDGTFLWSLFYRHRFGAETRSASGRIDRPITMSKTDARWLYAHAVNQDADLAAGADAMSLNRGMQQAVNIAVEQLGNSPGRSFRRDRRILLDGPVAHENGVRRRYDDPVIARLRDRSLPE